MPGFMMFEEYKDLPFPKIDADTSSIVKSVVRRLPMAWVAHGIKGEFNVDIDPVALLRGDGTDLLNPEAYTAWISVVSIDQTIQGTAEREREENDEKTAALSNRDHGAEGTSGKRTVTTNMKKPKDGRGAMTVIIEIDASLTQLIKAAMDWKKGDDDNPQKYRVFEWAEIHMCTTAQIDLSQLTSGGGPAAGLIATLAGALMFNIIPYLTITLKQVTIESIQYSVSGNATEPPTATLQLKFDQQKWTYHVINQSNMNLIQMSAEYDFTRPKDQDEEEGGLIPAGTVVNPFG